MPIRERTAKACLDVFVDHVSELVAATVPAKGIPFHGWRRLEDDFAIVGFRRGAPTSVPLDTRFGRLHFYLCQAVDAVWEQDNGAFRLRTLKYWYRLQSEPGAQRQAVIRWEYDRQTERSRHARHHLHVPASIDAGEASLDLNKLHVPTCWVTIEAVIRFLIVDLDVKPPCGDEWCDRLVASEDRFLQEFTGKREPALD